MSTRTPRSARSRNGSARRNRRRRFLPDFGGIVMLVISLGLIICLLLAVQSLKNWFDVWNNGSSAPPTMSSLPGDDDGPGPAPVSPDTTGFDATHIIDDEVFYNSKSMTEREISIFINQVNAGCMTGRDGTPCLSKVLVDTEDQDPTTTCPGGYEGAKGESAATIISKVSAACDVNPQVLLVLLQKEQGLLTASGRSLTAMAYTSATGYACPDGRACDKRFVGLFRQLYGAASQFQRYRLRPGNYQVVAGQPVELAYSPQASCGRAPLQVVNQATAGLYDYTPFQPNEAAASGGDACTSWGNWNFYGYFRTWFGDPTPST